MSLVWLQMGVGPFLGRFFAEGVDSFAGCKSSLVLLGLMTSVSSVIFSQVSSVRQSYWNLPEERAQVPAAPSPLAGKLLPTTGSMYLR